MRRFLVLITLSTSLAFGPVALSSQEVRVETHDDNTFVPDPVTISAGDTITFVNTGRLPHTATARDGSWDTGNLGPGQSQTVTITGSGTIEYACIYHEALGMVGTVVIEGEAPAAPESPAAADSPSPSPDAAAAADENHPNAGVPIGVKAFPFVGLGLLVLFAVGLFAAYVRTVFKTTGAS